MTTISPPPLAGRLLRRLVPAQDHDALLGDLCEEYQRRRSNTWYFFQILAAIIVGSWKDIRSHKLVVLRATVIGEALRIFAIEAVLRLRDIQTGGGFMLRGTWIGLPWYWHWPYLSPSFAVIMQLESVASYMFVGWIVVRLHRRHGVTMVLAYRGLALAFLSASFFVAEVVMWNRSIRPAYWLLLVLLGSSVKDSLWMLAGAYLATRQPKAA